MIRCLHRVVSTGSIDIQSGAGVTETSWHPPGQSSSSSSVSNNIVVVVVLVVVIVVVVMIVVVVVVAIILQQKIYIKNKHNHIKINKSITYFCDCINNFVPAGEFSIVDMRALVPGVLKVESPS